jgi:hypothetical protein
MRKVEYRFSKAKIYLLQVFQALKLNALEPTILLVQSIIRHFRNTYGSNGLSSGLPLRRQHIIGRSLETISSVLCRVLLIELSSSRVLKLILQGQTLRSTFARLEATRSASSVSIALPER